MDGRKTVIIIYYYVKIINFKTSDNHMKVMSICLLTVTEPYVKILHRADHLQNYRQCVMNYL